MGARELATALEAAQALAVTPTRELLKKSAYLSRSMQRAEDSGHSSNTSREMRDMIDAEILRRTGDL